MSRYSFEKFFSQSTENLRRGTFLLFTNILLSKNFMAKRWGMKQGGMSRYSVQNFLSQSTQIFVGEHFSFLQIFWYRKTSWLRGGEGSREECHDIRSKCFVSQYR